MHCGTKVQHSTQSNFVVIYNKYFLCKYSVGFRIGIVKCSRKCLLVYRSSISRKCIYITKSKNFSNKNGLSVETKFTNLVKMHCTSKSGSYDYPPRSVRSYIFLRGQLCSVPVLQRKEAENNSDENFPRID